MWAAVGSCLQAAVAAIGSVDDGLACLEAAMDQYRALRRPRSSGRRSSTSTPRFSVWPDGRATASRGASGTGGTRRTADAVAGTVVAQGSLLLADSNDATGAEFWFERAVQSADQLEAPMLQLPASALARLWCAQGKTEPARTLLTAAYERLTEGFTTADLMDARRLLDDLAAASWRGARPALNQLDALACGPLTYAQRCATTTHRHRFATRGSS